MITRFKKMSIKARTYRAVLEYLANDYNVNKSLSAENINDIKARINGLAQILIANGRKTSTPQEDVDFSIKIANKILSEFEED